MVNYKHLYYFWLVTNEAAMASVSERLSITLQTIGGQITLLATHFGTTLFQKVGRYIKLTATGRLVLIFADEIFSLGSELEQMMHHFPDSRPKQFWVGGADELSKSIGQTNELKASFYAISLERQILNPIASTIIKSPNYSLFAKGIYEYEQK